MKQHERNFLFLLRNCLLGKLIDMASLDAIIKSDSLFHAWCRELRSRQS